VSGPGGSLRRRDGHHAHCATVFVAWDALGTVAGAAFLVASAVGGALFERQLGLLLTSPAPTELCRTRRVIHRRHDLPGLIDTCCAAFS